MLKRSINKRYRLLLRWGVAGLGLGLVLTAGLSALSREKDPAALNEDGSVDGLTRVLDRPVTEEMVTLSFEETAERAGINFCHFPAQRDSLLPEDMGSGLAWGDYDNDGDPDLYLVNFAGRIQEPVADASGCNSLYRNNGDGTFTDVGQEAGVAARAFGMGAAWGDYDNDADLDLYVTNYGPNILYRNNGDGTFTDISVDSGVADPRFSASAAWGDYNKDGHIDLYVCNYVWFSFRDADRSRTTRQYGSEIPYTLNPSAYPAEKNALYRNNGDGTFTDVAATAGVSDPHGRSLSVSWVDLDEDGLQDLYVANDVSNNGVFRNRGDGTFEDIGAKSLGADYRGAMGLAVADPDHDGDQDLFITHWLAQENALFRNMYSDHLTDATGNRWLYFMDTADEMGLGQISIDMVGWGTSYADFDNDGYPDLWVSNGNTLEDRENHHILIPQPMHLFRQEPGRGFFEMGQAACASFSRPAVGRGGAHADYDGDGKLDLAISIHGGRPLLFHNQSNNSNHWLTVRLRQTGGNTNALGAWVIVQTGKLRQTAQVGTNGTYLSQNQLDTHFGLGQYEAATVTIRWPDGTHEIHENISADRVADMSHTPVYDLIAHRNEKVTSRP